MKHLFLITGLFAILMLAGNCRKSEISFEGGHDVGFSISGRVLDRNNVPVSQAEVKAGASTARTDVNGYFTLSNVRLPKNAAYVKVDKSGYFQGSRTFIASEGAMNYVSIRLIPKELTGSFSAASGGLVNLSSGSSISFQPNSVADAATNSAYTGTVAVSAFFIDPSQPGFVSIMPGDLRGTTTSGEERGLQSFGMMAVELTGSGGQKLQLSNGKPATINFNIPAALLSSAPSTIPLWYFDEGTGLWKQEGSANKQGNKYIGTVNHFSFWNCDAPFPVIEFEARVKDQNGNAVADATVTIQKMDDATIGYGKTNGDGKVGGKIPSNEALVMKIIDRCQTQLYSQNIGPFSGNVNLGTITVNIQPQASVTISGTAVTCNSSPVTNGFANISLDGMTYRAAITNGNFSIAITRCNGNPTQAQIFAEDIAATQQGSSASITVSSGNVNAGQLSACGTTTDEYVNYTLDGNNYAFTSPTDSLNFNYSDSAGLKFNALYAYNANNELWMDYKGPEGTGVFNINGVTVIHGATKYEGQGFNVTITQYGSIGQFVTGSFSGTVFVGGVTPHSLTCSFKVRRSN